MLSTSKPNLKAKNSNLGAKLFHAVIILFHTLYPYGAENLWVRAQFKDRGHCPLKSNLSLHSQNHKKIWRLDSHGLSVVIIHFTIKTFRAYSGSMTFNPLIAFGAQTSYQSTLDQILDVHPDQRKFQSLA